MHNRQYLSSITLKYLSAYFFKSNLFVGRKGVVLVMQTVAIYIIQNNNKFEYSFSGLNFIIFTVFLI